MVLFKRKYTLVLPLLFLAAMFGSVGASQSPRGHVGGNFKISRFGRLVYRPETGRMPLAKRQCLSKRKAFISGYDADCENNGKEQRWVPADDCGYEADREDNGLPTCRPAEVNPCVACLVGILGCAVYVGLVARALC